MNCLHVEIKDAKVFGIVNGTRAHDRCMIEVWGYRSRAIYIYDARAFMAIVHYSNTRYGYIWGGLEMVWRVRRP